MATPPKKTIPIASKSRAVMPWEAEMAQAAKKQAAVEKPMGLFKQIGVKGGVLMIDDKPVPKNTMSIVVLAATHENQWFDKPYNPAVPSVPACYAFGDQTQEDPEAAMTPSANVDRIQGGEEVDADVSEPKCATCWANVMGSADTGKGKACQNVRRLIVTTPDALESAEAMKDAEARSIKIPVMSVRNWVAFVHEIEETVNRPYYGVIAELTVVPDAKSQWQVKFAFQELITFDQPLWEATQKRVKAAAKDILTPYPKLEEQAPPAKANSKIAGKGTPVKPSGPAQRKGGKY